MTRFVFLPMGKVHRGGMAPNTQRRTEETMSVMSRLSVEREEERWNRQWAEDGEQYEYDMWLDRMAAKADEERRDLSELVRASHEEEVAEVEAALRAGRQEEEARLQA